ncbi:MAG: EVE domain-containing protein [Patescibacteria group bacterium]
MATFLAKTEPSEYSIDDLLADDITTWSGVRNPTAVQAIKSMQPGDRLLIYHSGNDPAIVGEGQIVTDPEPDQNDRLSWIVAVRFLHKFERTVSLKEIKESGYFDDWALVRQGRLSTMAVPEHFLVWFWERLREES